MHSTHALKLDREELTYMSDHDLAAAAYQEARSGEQGTAFDVLVDRQKEMHDRLYCIDNYESNFPANKRQRDALQFRAAALLHATTRAIEIREGTAEEND